MKRCFFFLACSIFSLAAFGQIDTLAYRKMADTIRKKLAPDKRTVYFDIRFKSDSVLVESTSADAIHAFEMMSMGDPQDKIALAILPAKQLKGQIYGVTTISVANNRSQPFHGAELMTQTLLGTPIQIFKKTRWILLGEISRWLFSLD